MVVRCDSSWEVPEEVGRVDGTVRIKGVFDSISPNKESL